MESVKIWSRHSAVTSTSSISGMTTVGGRFDIFTSIAGQTVFTPSFQPDSSTGVYENGYLKISGWTVVGATIIFTTVPPVGSQIVFENNNNIVIEKTIQVFLATPAQVAFSTLFTVTADSKITVSDLLTVYGTDWNIVAGVVTFIVPCIGGETIVIKK